MTPKTRILQQLADEAQHVAKTTTIDLAAFLALTSDARAARWRSFDAGTKHQLVALAIGRQTGRDWEPEEVAAGIAHYDAKYGDAPMASEAAVIGALERLAEENARTARQARARDDREDARFFQRAANAYTKALRLYRDGVRPELLPSGNYTLPSSRPGAPAHLLFKDGDWCCSCAAGASIHWASALVIGLELAADLLDAGMVGEGEADADGGTIECETCEGLGTMPAFGYGPLADGWKEPCEACEGKGHVPYDPAQTPGTPEYRLTVGAYLGRRLALARSKLLMDEALGKAA